MQRPRMRGVRLSVKSAASNAKHSGPKLLPKGMKAFTLWFEADIVQLDKTNMSTREELNCTGEVFSCSLCLGNEQHVGDTVVS